MICLNIFIIGGLFYLPVWFFWGFGLDWLTAARPLEQGLFGLFARFSYKTWIAIGLLQSLVIVYFIFKNFKDFKIKKKSIIDYFNNHKSFNIFLYSCRTFLSSTSNYFFIFIIGKRV